MLLDAFGLSQVTCRSDEMRSVRRPPLAKGGRFEKLGLDHGICAPNLGQKTLVL